MKNYHIKNLLFISILLFSTLIYAQDYTHASNPVVDVSIFKASEINGIENALTIQEGYFVTFSAAQGNFVWAYPDGSIGNPIYPGNTSLPAGFKIYIDWNGGSGQYLIVYGHEISTTESTFALNEIEDNSRTILFPNPTNSEVALNSEKLYEISVFDLLGNKVMELTGNSINMEHLSNATYIVNALDIATKENLTYKVIKK